jgi:hypothetical protein
MAGKGIGMESGELPGLEVVYQHQKFEISGGVPKGSLFVNALLVFGAANCA